MLDWLARFFRSTQESGKICQTASRDTGLKEIEELSALDLNDTQFMESVVTNNTVRQKIRAVSDVLEARIKESGFTT